MSRHSVLRNVRRMALAAGLALAALPTAASAAKVPGCTATANKHNGYDDVCFFVPSGNIITYTAKNISLPDGGGGITEYDPTCTTSTGFGPVIFQDAFRSTYTLTFPGDCLRVEAHSGQITASG